MLNIYFFEYLYNFRIKYGLNLQNQVSEKMF